MILWIDFSIPTSNSVNLYNNLQSVCTLETKQGYQPTFFHQEQAGPLKQNDWGQGFSGKFKLISTALPSINSIIIIIIIIIEPAHEISNNVVCATSKASDQPAHTRSLIRPFARRLSIL